MYKRKRNKIVVIAVIIFLIWLILGIILYNRPTTPNDKLQKIGYSQLEADEITKRLSDKNINLLLKRKYSKKVVKIISDSNFKEKYFFTYLDYSDKYRKTNTSIIVDLINNPEFKEENAIEYFKLLEDYKTPKAVIIWVNNNYNEKDIELSDITMDIMNEDYFIEKDLTKYLDYYKNNINTEPKEIVTAINCNLDKKFYLDVKEADLSKGMYTLVNKLYYLKEDFIPSDIVKIEEKYGRTTSSLNKEAYEAFKLMADDASKENLTLYITTGYRDYKFQKTLYDNYVKQDGADVADSYSARPGHSEHQLGYSIDLSIGSNYGLDSFKNTKEDLWMRENAHKYGFILRYKEGYEYLTGYVAEAWHYRYVGHDVSKYIYENNIVYEEYYEYFIKGH